MTSGQSCGGSGRMAERLGHRVASASSFDEALACLQGQGSYDALLVDVHLEETHSGFDLFDTLRLEGRGLERRVIFTTGDSISARTRDELHVSGRPVLKKPFNLEELRQMLSRMAGERTGVPPQLTSTSATPSLPTTSSTLPPRR